MIPRTVLWLLCLTGCAGAVQATFSWSPDPSNAPYQSVRLWRCDGDHSQCPLASQTRWRQIALFPSCGAPLCRATIAQTGHRTVTYRFTGRMDPMHEAPALNTLSVWIP